MRFKTQICQHQEYLEIQLHQDSTAKTKIICFQRNIPQQKERFLLRLWRRNQVSYFGKLKFQDQYDYIIILFLAFLDCQDSDAKKIHDFFL